MKRTLIAIVAAMVVAGSANAYTIHMAATNPMNVAGSVSTVTVTLTIGPGGEVIPALGSFTVQVGWNPAVVRVVGSNPAALSFGKSTQSAMLTVSAGAITPALTPLCVSAGINKGKACNVISQAALTGATVNPNQVVIGTLLLEVLGPPGGPDPIGTSLGLIITSYITNTVTGAAAADPDRTIDPSFPSAQIVPEPATAALLGLGLLGLGFVGRRRA